MTKDTESNAKSALTSEPTAKQSNPTQTQSESNNIQESYIAFLDSDDYFEPNACEIMLDLMQKNPCDVVVFWFNAILENASHRTIEKKAYENYKLKNGLFSAPKDLSFSVAAPWNKLYKASIIFNNNLRFTPLRVAEDVVFYWDYFMRIKNYYLTNAKLYNYRMSADSQSGDMNKLIDRFRAEILIYRSVCESGKLEFYKENLIANHLWCVDFYLPKLKDRKSALKIMLEYKNLINDYRITKNYYRLKFEREMNMLKKIFEIKNDGSFKKITLFGISFKIRRKNKA